jgi:hypothetical protein
MQLISRDGDTEMMSNPMAMTTNPMAVAVSGGRWARERLRVAIDTTAPTANPEMSQPPVLSGSPSSTRAYTGAMVRNPSITQFDMPTTSRSRRTEASRRR